MFCCTIALREELLRQQCLREDEVARIRAYHNKTRETCTTCATRVLPRGPHRGAAYAAGWKQQPSPLVPVGRVGPNVPERESLVDTRRVETAMN